MSDESAKENGQQPSDESAERGESPLAIVSALMGERRKYESWLETLEAKRASTPDRVFTRVHADYSTRLDGVLADLKSHAEGLRAELASLTTRVAAVEEQQQAQRDERAEAELRAHVGELAPDAWNELAAKADQSLEELSVRHGELDRELVRTRELLAEAERPPTPRGAKAVPEVPAPVSAAPPAPVVSAAPAAPAMEASAAPAPVPRREPDAASAAPSSMQSSVQPPAPMAATESAMPTELPPQVIAAQARLVEQEETAAAADRGDADVTPPPTQRADAARTSGESAGGFDELAFLSSVVDTPTGTIDVPAPTERGDERSRRDSFAQRAAEDDIVNLSSDPGAMLEGTAPARSSPLAMNVSGNIPIVIKDKTAEAAKSLKCGECGSMNYPTEWYCERCGAELASL